MKWVEMATERDSVLPVINPQLPRQTKNCCRGE